MIFRITYFFVSLGAQSIKVSRKIYNVALKMDQYIENNPFFRLLGISGAIIGVAAACFTFYQIIVDLSDRRGERIIRSWDHLLKPVGGNTGKADAIEILFGYGISVDNVVLPCPVKDDEGNCKWRIVVEGLFDQSSLPLKELMRDGWQDTVMGYGVISGADLSHADIRNSELSQWVLEGLIADDTHWRNVNFSGSQIVGSFNNSLFEAVDFGDTLLYGDMTGSQLLLSNLSGALISLGDETGENKNARLPDLTMSWFWADQPPFISLNGKEVALEELNIGFVCDFGGEFQELDGGTKANENLILALLETGSGAREVSCNDPISLEVAKARYPKRYGPNKVDCKSEDEGRSYWERDIDVSRVSGC